jgi:hypothetical protein
MEALSIMRLQGSNIFLNKLLTDGGVCQPYQYVPVAIYPPPPQDDSWYYFLLLEAWS